MHVELPIQAKLEEEKKGDTIKSVKHCLGFIPAVVTRSTNQTFLFCPNSTEFGVVGVLVLLVVAVLFSVCFCSFISFFFQYCPHYGLCSEWGGSGDLQRSPPVYIFLWLIKALKGCWIWQRQTHPGNVKLELITTTFVKQNPLMPLYGHLILGLKPLLPDKCWMEQSNFKTLRWQLFPMENKIAEILGTGKFIKLEVRLWI